MSRQQATKRSRHPPLRLTAYSALASVIVLLAACALPSTGNTALPTATVVRVPATATPPPPPTSVIVVRLSGFVAQTRVAPFQMTSHDVPKVQQLYQTARALPANHSAFGCTQSQAIGYELSFMHGATLVAQVLMINGCRLLEVSGLPGCRDWPPSFTTQVAATLGVPVTTLYPATPDGLLNTAGPNGPFAQAVPTEPVLVSEKCSY